MALPKTQARTDLSHDASGSTRTGSLHRRRMAHRRELPWAFGAIAVLTAASAATLALVRHQGVGIGGDEPYYLVAAVAIGRFHTLNMNAGFDYAVAHHAIFPWHAKPGPHLAAAIGQREVLVDRTIYLPTHAIGLSVLLALPMLAGTSVAVGALMLVLALLAVALTHLVGEVAGLRSPWRYALAALFLAPSYLLATTQVYPDLISGLIVAIVLMLVAVAEQRGSVTTAQLVAGAALLVLFPWLDQKNVLLALVPLGALVAVVVRRQLPRGQFGWLTGPAVVSILAVVALNLWGFGRPLGQWQPVSLLSWETTTRAVGLLLDRRQGLFVQLPIVVLGVAGAWAMRRRAPVAVAAAAAFVAADVLGNATQEVSFGGGSFVGRFGWPAVPVLLAFTGLYFVELWKVRRRASWLLIGVAALLAALSAAPIVAGEHLYFNHYAWDPATYTGWWGGLDPSPVLGYLGGVLVSGTMHAATNAPVGIAGLVASTDPWSNARNLWGLLTLLTAGALILYVLVRLLRRPARVAGSVVLTLSTTTIIGFALTLSSHFLLPGPATFSAASLLSGVAAHGTERVATGVSEHGTVATGPYWTLLPGRYVATVVYRLDDPAPDAAEAAVVAITRPPAGGLGTLASGPLSNTRTTKSLPFSLAKPEEVTVHVLWQGTGTLEVGRIVLAKVAVG